MRTKISGGLGLCFQVLPKRTNLPGISSTDRGGLRGHPGARVGSFPDSGLQGGARFRPRGRSRWAGPWEGGILLGWGRGPVGGALEAAHLPFSFPQGTRKILTVVFSVLKRGRDFESGVCHLVRNQHWCS